MKTVTQRVFDRAHVWVDRERVQMAVEAGADQDELDRLTTIGVTAELTFEYDDEADDPTAAYLWARVAAWKAATWVPRATEMAS